MSLMRKSLFQNALFYILPIREKSGWILYQITDLVIIRVKTMILFLGQWPMMMCTGHLPSILLAY